jgi:hypothetical protein
LAGIGKCVKTVREIEQQKSKFDALLGKVKTLKAQVAKAEGLEA